MYFVEFSESANWCCWHSRLLGIQTLWLQNYETANFLAKKAFKRITNKICNLNFLLSKDKRRSKNLMFLNKGDVYQLLIGIVHRLPTKTKLVVL